MQPQTPEHAPNSKIRNSDNKADKYKDKDDIANEALLAMEMGKRLCIGNLQNTVRSTISKTHPITNGTIIYLYILLLFMD